MFEAMALLDDITLDTPIKVGDVIIEDIFHTGINVVACKNIMG